MSIFHRISILALCLAGPLALGQAAQRDPHIGYLYPDGGQRGTTVEVEAGGQRLGGVKAVHISGAGVRTTVKYFVRPARPLEKEQRQELTRRLRAREAALTTEAPGGEMSAEETQMMAEEMPEMEMMDTVELPGDPILRDLNKLNAREVEFVISQFLMPRKRQENVQIAERVLLEMTIDPDAAPGEREIRLETNAGLTNPMRFHVGMLPEMLEQESRPMRKVRVANFENSVGAFPTVLNGQILPGDTDRYRFRAQRGEELVFHAFARSLNPYLADAVPGWFQATLLLEDAQGREVAFADDYQVDPDPVMHCRIPEDGEYVIEIRDALYRGREDFVYRVAVGKEPFVTRVFPLGGREGVPTRVAVEGWNLPQQDMSLDTTVSGTVIHATSIEHGVWQSNRIAYAVNTLPELVEQEPNDLQEAGTRVTLPVIVNGQISTPGDVDVFCFEGRAGAHVVVDVDARRLNSPLDALLRLSDAAGKVIAWNDDHDDPEAGWLTHQADAYLSAILPEDGVYVVALGDAQEHGDVAYGYRLRISPPQPDFSVRVTPSSLNLRAGRSAAITAHVLRKDGFEGEIALVLKDAPPGFSLEGGRIPAGRDTLRMTVSVRGKAAKTPYSLQLEARAEIGGAPVTRPVIPAEDMMQAFIYQHLVPSKELLATVGGAPGPAPRIALGEGGTVQIPTGGRAEVLINVPRAPVLQDIQLALNEPPKGITIEEVRVVPQGLAFALKADADAGAPGFLDNLIVEAFTNRPPPQQNAKRAAQNQRVSLGVLPAIPAEIVP